MKEFNLGKAQAGEPVLLRNGEKAYVIGVIPDEFDVIYPVRGFRTNNLGVVDIAWTKAGKYHGVSNEHEYDIVGMWEEPQPKLAVVIPAPLKEPRDGMYYIDGKNIRKSMFAEDNQYVEAYMKSTFYFATEEDAREFINAIESIRC